MQGRAFALQSESDAEEAEQAPIDLGAVRARPLVVVGELDKPDFHAIAERLANQIDGAQAARIAGADSFRRSSARRRPPESCANSSGSGGRKDLGRPWHRTSKPGRERDGGPSGVRG